MTLVEYGKKELSRIGMIGSGQEYNERASQCILDLLELFSSQGHSGFTGSYTLNVFERLAKFKPLSPLTGEDDEWDETSPGHYQNVRCPSVFKEDEGKAYDLNGKVFTDDGEVWYSNQDSTVDVTFPYNVPDKPEHIYNY